jgi:hypothetical protein
MSISLPNYSRSKLAHFDAKSRQKKKNIKDITNVLNQVDQFLHQSLTLRFDHIGIGDARKSFKKYKLETKEEFIIEEDAVNDKNVIEKLQVQGLKDITYLSDSNYQIWRNSNQNIGPSLHKLKEIRKVLNSIYPIHKNIFGYYINPMHKIQLVINESLKLGTFTRHEEINIKLCGDGFNITRSNLKIINISFTVINQGQIAKTAKGNYLLGIIHPVLFLFD